MDDETSSRLRDLLIYTGLRQRPAMPDPEAVRRRLLASTLRLAGHAVSQNPAASASAGDDGNRRTPRQ